MALKIIDHGSREYQQMVQLRNDILRRPLGLQFTPEELDRKSTRLNSSHSQISYAVFCLKKKMRFAPNRSLRAAKLYRVKRTPRIVANWIIVGCAHWRPICNRSSLRRLPPFSD